MDMWHADLGAGQQQLLQLLIQHVRQVDWAAARFQPDLQELPSLLPILVQGTGDATVSHTIATNLKMFIPALVHAPISQHPCHLCRSWMRMGHLCHIVISHGHGCCTLDALHINCHLLRGWLAAYHFNELASMLKP